MLEYVKEKSKIFTDLGKIFFPFLDLCGMDNATRDRALKSINKISQAKYLVSDVKDLTLLIGRKLSEDFQGKFWIIVKKDKSSFEPYKAHQIILEQVFNSSAPEVIYEDKKVLYFHPISIAERNIAILVTEIKSDKVIGVSSLIKALPFLADHVAIIIDNFETHLRLNKAKVNEEREKLRSLILSSVSHDLKTPLSSIIGSLRIFKSLDDKHKLTRKNINTLITTALEEAERLDSFISEVLEMTRIESGAIKLNKKLLMLENVVSTIFERFDREIRKYRLKITLNPKVQINFDPTALNQIVQNLIDNTIKYSPRNAKITVMDELDQNAYRVFIRDEGRGIAPDKLEVIFNKFERFNSEDKITGSGLGLSIVKALMEINNATISAKNSEEGKGAIFILEFRDFVVQN